jgi:hypothetical protein
MSSPHEVVSPFACASPRFCSMLAALGVRIHTESHAAPDRQISVAVRAPGKPCAHRVCSYRSPAACLLSPQGHSPLPRVVGLGVWSTRNPGRQLLSRGLRPRRHQPAVGPPPTETRGFLFPNQQCGSSPIPAALPNRGLRGIPIHSRPARLLSCLQLHLIHLRYACVRS